MQNYSTNRSTNALTLAPNPPATFEGRREQMASLTAMLETKERVVIAVQGLGGIGKTAIALQLAHDLQSQFPGGVFWCSLPDNQGNVQSILRQWGIFSGDTLSHDIGLAELSIQLRQTLQARRDILGPILFIFDDLRPEWREALQDLLDICPANSTILITLRDERLVPAEALVYHLDILPQDEALRLLKKSSGIQGRKIIEANQNDAKALLTEVGFLPLGIEVLGTYLRRMCRKPGFQLHDVQKNLTGYADNTMLLPEYSGLFAIFANSYQELTAEVQRVFRWLGAFAEGPLLLDQMAAVIGLSQTRLEALCDNELVSISFLAWGSKQGEYKIHPLLRHYSQQLLTDQADAEVEQYQQQIIRELPLLHQLMEASFNDDEIRQLCFDLSIDYENLGGQTKQAKIRELLNEARRANQLQELIALCQREREHLDWPGYMHGSDEQNEDTVPLSEQLQAEQSHQAFFVSLAKENTKQEVATWDNLERNLSNLLLASKRSVNFHDATALITLEEALIHSSSTMSH